MITGFGWNWVDLGYNPHTGLVEETGGGGLGKMRVADAKILSTADCNRNMMLPATRKHICAKVVQRKPSKPEGICSVSTRLMNLKTQKYQK